MQTLSEKTIAYVNQNVFYKEFTFDKNEFYPSPGQKKELADNIVLLDDLLFIIQIKERNTQSTNTAEEENKWFNNVVLKKAKNQIKDSVAFFTEHDIIPITNRRQQTIDVSKASLKNSKKVIIYASQNSSLNDEYRFMKFYQSRDIGNIHLFHIEDYFWVCKYLLTPTELDEYFNFRESLFIRHKEAMNRLPEQYVLAHFLNTDDEAVLRPEYINTLGRLQKDFDDFDMSVFLNSFIDRVNVQEQRQSTDYYHIIKQIAKLTRYELREFKKRFQLIIDNAKDNKIQLPYRFTLTRTQCGFVFIPLTKEKAEYWENALLNFTAIYKYKRKINKCLGVVIYKKDDYFDVYWAYMEHPYEYDKVLEQAVKEEEEGYGKTEYKSVERYNFDPE